jgi:hypothetical protein
VVDLSSVIKNLWGGWTAGKEYRLLGCETARPRGSVRRRNRLPHRKAAIHFEKSRNALKPQVLLWGWQVFWDGSLPELGGCGHSAGFA